MPIGTNLITELEEKSKRTPKPRRDFPPPPPEFTPPPPPSNLAVPNESPAYAPPPSSPVSMFPYPRFYNGTMPTFQQGDTNAGG